MRAIIHNGQARISVGMELTQDEDGKPIVVGAISAFNLKKEDKKRNWSRRSAAKILNERLDGGHGFIISRNPPANIRKDAFGPVMDEVRKLSLRLINRKTGATEMRTKPKRSVMSLVNRIQAIFAETA
jgi:hypothetical protein